MKYKLLIIFICSFIIVWGQEKRYTLSGYVKEKGSAEMLLGASIAIPGIKSGTISNNYGFYTLTLKEGIYEVIVTYIGYKPKAFSITLNKNIEMDVIMEISNTLKELVVSADKQMQHLADETRMSVIEIPIQQIKDIPALMGEKDVLKVIQLLPGVQKGSEGSSGIYVRGGGPDQNLIILDDAIVYNAYHLFGFFSLFNGDALKSVELTKGGFPARYGGRLSSVIEMNMKEGNKEKLHGEAGIGLIASRLLLEGPIVKGKSSFLVSGRRTYIDVLSLPFQTGDFKGGYFFYDLNAKANYEFDNRNRLFVSGYFGRDKFYLKSQFTNDSKEDFSLSWGNSTATVRWNHLYNNQTFANTSFIFSNFLFNISEESKRGADKFLLSYSSGITDFSIKHDIDYRPNTNHTIKTGIHLIHHSFVPSAIVFKNDFTGENLNSKNAVGSFENAIYIEDDIKAGDKFRLNPGLRISHFNSQSKHYVFPEPRLSISYKIKSDLAVKSSFAIMNQFVHLLSNSGIGLPTDLWVPSSTNLKPKQSWQLAAGIAKDFIKKEFSISVEGYYKESKNIIAYKDGASFLELGSGNEKGSYAWEENIVAGKGWSYGAEFLLQKKTGDFTGWIGYTLSWTQMQFDELNFGEKFWARYDRRHDISVVGIYKLREESENHNGVKLSVTWVYGTGNAITLPVAEYNAPIHMPGLKDGGGSFFNGSLVSEYTGRNQFRMGAYHRMDLGVQVQKKMKHYVRTWEFSFYNLYNRANPYFYFIGSPDFGNQNQKTLMQVSLFPIIPSISWNIKF